MKKIFLLLSVVLFPLNALAAEGHDLDWKTFGWRVAMFIVFIALLWYFTNKPVKKLLIKRTESIREALDAAEKAKNEAVAQMKEYEEKMVQLEKELEMMKESARKTALAEKDFMIEETKKQIELMKQFAVNTIQSETERAKHDLQEEVVNLAMEKAEKRLIQEVTGQNATNLLNNYVKGIGE